MKLAIVALAILTTTSLFANCRSEIEAALKSANRASVGSDLTTEANTNFQQAIKDEASNEELCDLAGEARMSGYLTAQDLKDAKKSFLNAYSLCSYPTDAEAKKNADQAERDFQKFKTFVERMDQVISKAKCEGEQPDLASNL